MSTAGSPLLGTSASPPQPRSPPWRPFALAAAGALLLGTLLSLLAHAVTTLGPRVAHAWRSRAPRAIAGHDIYCDDPMYAKTTLKVIDEYPIARLVFENGGFDAARGLRKFEASDVAVVPGVGNPFYVVLDNSFKIFELGAHFSAGKEANNKLLEWPGDDGSDSQFEVLAYNLSSKSFVAVQEMIEHDDGHLHAKMFDVVFEGGKAVVQQECHSEYKFSKENKGFEGGVVLDGLDGTSYLLSLCEGNHCAGGKKGRDVGHGVLVAQKRAVKDGKCVFETVGRVKLPKEISFMDYSAITLNQNSPGPGGEMQVAVASQENSAVWIGTISPAQNELFTFGKGKIYDFPRDSNCKRVYCNVEGLAFADDHTLIAVSDAMKSRGKQDFRCWEKAQSVHLVTF